jgi:hypothetical protein
MAPPEPAELEDYLQLAAGILATIILVVALLSYRRRPTKRTLLVTLAFALLFVRSVFHALSDFAVGKPAGDVLEGLAVPLEIGFLLLITVAFLRT